MATAAALVVYALVLVPSVVVVWRRPVLALYAFLVGLAVYNLAMALLYGAGVHGAAIEALQTWKEILLGTAALRVARDAWVARELPFRPRTPDLLALAFAGLVVLYALIPQSALGGHADLKGVVYGLRHDLTPVLAYFVGRSLPLSRKNIVSLGWTLAGTAAAVAAFGLIDLYAVPIEWWRDSGAVGFFRHQGYDYHGPGGLPENFVFNVGFGHVYRRLTSVFLGPLGSAYLLAIALIAAAAGGPLRRRPRLLAALAFLWAVALLLTLSRSTILSLAGAFVILALVMRRWWPVAAAAVAVAALVGLNSAFSHVAPKTHFFPADLKYQREHAQETGGSTKPNGFISSSEPSLKSHLHLLRVGTITVAHHPQGFGLGNAGVTAIRFHAPPKAGESTYTELGVETGVLGALAFVAWSLAVLWALVTCARREVEERRWACTTMAAAFALVLALAIQTDVLGVLWLAFGIWWLVGAVVSPEESAPASARR